MDRRGVAWGILGVAVLLALTFFGSDGLRWFDAALVGYLLGLACRGVRHRLPLPGVVATTADGAAEPAGMGVVPPGPAAPQRRRPRGSGRQRTCWRRASSAAAPRGRWAAHQSVFWGCMLAAAVTVPADLRVAALRDRSARTASEYQAYVFGVGTVSLRRRPAWSASLVFHLLDIAALLVIAGVLVFLLPAARRPRSAGRRTQRGLPRPGRAVRRVGHRPVPHRVEPVAARGATTASSTTCTRSRSILGLLYIPFGKLFHIFQRPANLGVHFYKDAGTPRRPAAVSAVRRPSSPPRCRSPISRTSCRRSASTTTTGRVAAGRTPARRVDVHRSRSRRSPRVGGFG